MLFRTNFSMGNFFVSKLVLFYIFSIISCEINESQYELNKFLSLNHWLGKFPFKWTTRRPEITTTIDPNEDPAVSRFRQYLRTNSAHPNPNYDASVAWIRGQAEEIGLRYRKIDFPSPNLFAVVLTWPGTIPSLGSIMMDSHIDTVAVDRSRWTYDPFEAFKDEQGNIYGRGAQDRKSQGAQYLEAIRRLKSQGFEPLRTIYVSFIPDEEIGGARGMVPFLASSEFQAMNVSVVIEEGAATPDATFHVFYGERAIWRYRIKANGTSTHTALMLGDNAPIKLNNAIAALMEFREQQVQLLASNPELEQGDVTAINLSRLGGGIAGNIVPSEVWAEFDMRIRLTTNFGFDDVLELLDNVVEQAGPGVSYEFIMREVSAAESSIEQGNFWWDTIQTTFDEFGWEMVPRIFPAATDARHIRARGIPAYGFSPLPFTTPLGHQDDEFLNEQTFVNGIKAFEMLIPRLANA